MKYIAYFVGPVVAFPLAIVWAMTVLLRFPLLIAAWGAGEQGDQVAKAKLLELATWPVIVKD